MSARWTVACTRCSRCPFRGHPCTTWATDYEGRCGICVGTSVRLEGLVTAIADGVLPAYGHGLLLCVQCACESAHVHLTCVLSSDYHLIADEELGCLMFRCTICGCRYDMTYREKSGELALRGFYLRGSELMVDTWFNHGDLGNQCRKAVFLPSMRGPHLWDPASKWTRSQR